MKKIFPNHLVDNVDDAFVSGKGNKLNKSNYKLNKLVPSTDLGIPTLQSDVSTLQLENLEATGTLTTSRNICCFCSWNW